MSFFKTIKIFIVTFTLFMPSSTASKNRSASFVSYYLSRRALVELSSQMICLLFLLFSAFANRSLFYLEGIFPVSSSRLFRSLILVYLAVKPLISILMRSQRNPRSSTDSYLLLN